MSWYQKGQEGIKRSKIEDEMARKRKESSNIWRFWQSHNSSREIIFLDNPDFFFHEHSLWNLTKKSDYATCIKDMGDGPCTLCDYGNPSYSLAATIIDLSKQESVNKTTGEVRVFKNQKRLFVAKGRARQVLLRRMSENGGNLAGALFVVSRGSESNEAGTGEDFVFKGFVKKEKLAKLCPPDTDVETWLTPYDYAKILAPMSAAQMRQLTGTPAPIGSDEDLLDSNIDDQGIDSLLSENEIETEEDQTPNELDDLL